MAEFISFPPNHNEPTPADPLAATPGGLPVPLEWQPIGSGNTLGTPGVDPNMWTPLGGSAVNAVIEPPVLPTSVLNTLTGTPNTPHSPFGTPVNPYFPFAPPTANAPAPPNLPPPPSAAAYNAWLAANAVPAAPKVSFFEGRRAKKQAKFEAEHPEAVRRAEQDAERQRRFEADQANKEAHAQRYDRLLERVLINEALRLYGSGESLGKITHTEEVKSAQPKPVELWKFKPGTIKAGTKLALRLQTEPRRERNHLKQIGAEYQKQMATEESAISKAVRGAELDRFEAWLGSRKTEQQQAFQELRTNRSVREAATTPKEIADADAALHIAEAKYNSYTFAQWQEREVNRQYHEWLIAHPDNEDNADSKREFMSDQAEAKNAERARLKNEYEHRLYDEFVQKHQLAANGTPVSFEEWNSTGMIVGFKSDPTTGELALDDDEQPIPVYAGYRYDPYFEEPTAHIRTVGHGPLKMSVLPASAKHTVPSTGSIESRIAHGPHPNIHIRKQLAAIIGSRTRDVGPRGDRELQNQIMGWDLDAMIDELNWHRTVRAPDPSKPRTPIKKLSAIDRQRILQHYKDAFYRS